MKKKQFLVLFLVGVYILVFATGCKEVEPEPYAKMIESLNTEDLKHAETYADLVINDFADSDYTYNAYLVKNMVQASKLRLEYTKCNLLAEGVDNINVYLVTESDLNRLTEYLEKAQNQIEKHEGSFYETTKYLVEHYEEADKVKLEFPEKTDDSLFTVENDLSSLYFFSSVGYPVPSDAEMSDQDDSNLVKIYRQLRNGDYGNESFSYPRYFYLIACICDNAEVRETLCKKIIEITADDTYNQYRLDAQEYLDNNK